MIKLYYDFHIHSALSPCGEDDMTPNNIVNMSILKELDAIALTDHNSVLNLEVIAQIAKENDILFLPGMELETEEEVHILCYFQSVDKTLKFGAHLKQFYNGIKNSPEIYGEQRILDKEDNIIGYENQMLVTPVMLDIYRAKQEVERFGGICVPAHVDKDAYSLISNLGFVPPDIYYPTIEVSRRGRDKQFEKRPDLKGKKIITNSDAHYLVDIAEKQHYIEIEENSIECVFEYLKS